MIPERTQVVVLGAGPVGLATALQLGKWGVDTLLLERRSTLSRHPKAGGIHARTMEIYRRWGVADEIRSVGRGTEVIDPTKPLGPTGAGWMTRLNGIPLGHIAYGSSAADVELFASYSPESGAGCGQDLYEPILYRVVQQHDSVTTMMGTRGVLRNNDDNGVSVELINEQSGETIGTVRADYVVSCEGIRSSVRSQLNIGESGTAPFGNSINVRFSADLEEHRDGRRFGLFWVVNADTQGALGWRRRGNEWTYNFEAKPGEDPAIYDEDRCAEIVRQAVGDPTIDVQIESILHWQHDQAVADRWSSGRVFLAGDAVHRFPPHGGFGMNSGVQDSVNLAWKLAAVVAGNAPAGLLDSYEVERRPVAVFNGEQALINTRNMEETGWLLEDASGLSLLEQDSHEGSRARAEFAESVQRQREQFYSQGQQFGLSYSSPILVDDQSPAIPSTVSEYLPNARPGSRAPHLWLRAPDGEQLSTIDLFYEGFVVLAGSDGSSWATAAAQVADELGVRIDAHVVGVELDLVAPDSLGQLYGIASDGAVLVRPDGYVAYRSSHAPKDAYAALSHAMGIALGFGSGEVRHGVLNQKEER